MKWNNDKKILVVDDDKQLAETVAGILKAKGLLVKVAQDGVSAQSIIALEDFDLIISDIRMPMLGGIELLHFVKRTKKTPVALMTGFSEIEQAKEAYEMGAVGFLPKPFKQADLLDLVTKVIGSAEVAPKAEAASADIDHEFTGLRIEDFVSGKEILFDIHIRISSSKYIKVASGGDSIDLERVLKYKAKGIAHLYLRKEDFRKYIGFTTNLARKVADSSLIDDRRKLQFLSKTSAAMIKDLYLGDLEQDSFKAASEMVITTIDVAGEDSEALALFEALKSHGDHLYRHSIAVSLYSILIAKAFGWNSPRTIARLSLCGLLHDIGKKEISADILSKPRIGLSADEIRLLESHPKRGMEILSRVHGLPEEVPLVALQHHEDNRGMGYPGHLTKNKISPISRLVALANHFCDLVFKAPGYEGMTPEEAINNIFLHHEGMFDDDFTGVLAGMFKVPVPNGKEKKL